MKKVFCFINYIYNKKLFFFLFLLGHYSKSIKYLEVMLPAIEEQYGANSIEISNELQKLSDVLMCNIRTMETTPSK